MNPDILKGKKTYIASALVALSSGGVYLSGHSVWAVALGGVALGFYGLRRAIYNLVEDAKAK